MKRLLIVENLYVDLGEFKIEKISFTVDEGDYVCIIGPTGSGKTILIETIAGLYRPRRGSIILNGEDITNLPPEKRNIGIVYQDYALFPHMSVFDNIAFGLKKRIKVKGEILREVKRIAQKLEIEHLLNRNPTTLSGGEQQRVALARALVVRPKLLLMDEPFSALDSKTRDRLRRLVKNVTSEYGTTVIHVTHDFEDVWTLANKAMVMYGGKILQYGTVDEVFSRPCCKFIADFVDVNMIEGVVMYSDYDKTIVRIGVVDIISKDKASEGSKVKVFIRPENIVIMRSKPINIFDNIIPGYIEKVEKRGGSVYVWVRVDDIIIKCVITLGVLNMLNICNGESIYLCFRSDDVKLLVT